MHLVWDFAKVVDLLRNKSTCKQHFINHLFYSVKFLNDCLNLYIWEYLWEIYHRDKECVNRFSVCTFWKDPNQSWIQLHSVSSFLIRSFKVWYLCGWTFFYVRIWVCQWFGYRSWRQFWDQTFYWIFGRVLINWGRVSPWSLHGICQTCRNNTFWGIPLIWVRFGQWDMPITWLNIRVVGV